MIHSFLVDIVVLCTLQTLTWAHAPSTWSGWGGGILNNRYARLNSVVNSRSIRSIRTHCHFPYPTGVSATPVVSAGGIAYFPTWNGFFIALDYLACKEKWRVNVTAICEENKPGSAVPEIAELLQAVSRTSPQIDEDEGVLYFATSLYALVVALDLESGTTLGAMPINGHPAAVVTQSPTIYDGTLFVGTSSSESAAVAKVPGYRCCSFVGNFVALTFDRQTGEFDILWNVTMVPEELSGIGKWSGFAVWGSQPSIDVERNQVFVASGNTYTTPESYSLCRNHSRRTDADECLPREVWQDSVLAIDIDSGDVNWVRQVPSLNTSEDLPAIATPDADFGMAPTFVAAGHGTSTPDGRDFVAVGQKNGNLYALDAETGESAWATVTGPGGGLGGLSWGIAVDGSRAYYAQLNNDGRQWQLLSSNLTTNGSFYGAVDLKDGKIAWETIAQGKGVAYGPPSTVGDVVICSAPVASNSGGLIVEPGALVVLDVVTGSLLQSIKTDAPIHGGVAVQGPWLLFGSGYQGYTGSGAIHVLRVH